MMTKKMEKTILKLSDLTIELVNEYAKLNPEKAKILLNVIKNNINKQLSYAQRMSHNWLLEIKSVTFNGSFKVKEFLKSFILFHRVENNSVKMDNVFEKQSEYGSNVIFTNVEIDNVLKILGDEKGSIYVEYDIDSEDIGKKVMKEEWNITDIKAFMYNFIDKPIVMKKDVVSIKD